MYQTASPQQRIIQSKMPVIPSLRNPALHHRLHKGAGEYILISKLNNLIGDNDIYTQDSSSIKKKFQTYKNNYFK